MKPNQKNPQPTLHDLLELERFKQHQKKLSESVRMAEHGKDLDRFKQLSLSQQKRRTNILRGNLINLKLFSKITVRLSFGSLILIILLAIVILVGLILF